MNMPYQELLDMETTLLLAWEAVAEEKVRRNIGWAQLARMTGISRGRLHRAFERGDDLRLLWLVAYHLNMKVTFEVKPTNAN